jgi:hypothetical protein
MIRSVSLTRLFPAVVLTGLLSGCFHHHPYGHGGYHGAPGPYAPYQTLTPGQPYVPGGVSPGMGVPQGPSPTFEGGGGGLQPIPDGNTNGGGNGGSNAPPFDSGSGNMNVPDPYFPNNNPSSSYNLQSPSGNGIQPANHTHPQPVPHQPGIRELKARPMHPAATASSPAPHAAGESYGSVSEQAPRHADAGGTSIGGTASGSTDGTTAIAEETFSLPRTVSEGNPFPGDAPPTESAAEPEGARPMFEFQTNKVPATDQQTFAHGPDYEWLQGVVSFEPQDGVWSIIYSDDPSSDDQLAGHVSFAPSPYLDQLQEGDVVKVEGQVDSLVRDSLGKPVYLISTLTRLASQSE